LEATLKAFPNGVITNKDGLIVGGQQGMDLRDWFAGQALSGMIAHGLINDAKATEGYADYLSAIAYIYADQMMKEREK